ncbi:MAG: T9SS type A sorting domain-containing protein [Flavobacterium sp.]|nr:T9SS type A sorting domain-containing protein [Flavobacterium sp.]
MKKIYLLLFFASFFIGNAQVNWKRSVSGANAPSWMGTTTTNTERGMGALNDKMYVVSRTGGLFIKVINGLDGTDLPNVSDYTGVTGGTFALNDVEVSPNGAILACNLLATTYDAANASTTTFKIYKWDNDTSAPSVYATYVFPSAAEHVRLGDNFSVTGDISGNAVIFAAGKFFTSTGYKVFRWIVTGGVIGAPTIITIPNLATSSTVLSVTPLTISAEPDFIIKASGNTLTKYNADGTLTGETIANAVIPLSANDTRYFEVGTKKYVASYLYGTSNEYAKLVDVTAGFASASTVAVTPVLGTVANGNGSGGIGLKIIPDLVDGINNTITVYTLGCNNGISGKTLISNGITLGNKDFSVIEKHNAAKIFPNPASNEFYIAIDTNLERDAQAFIYDTQGRQVKSTKIDANIQTVSIQDLNAGEYLVKVLNGKNNTTAKLLKK